MRWWEATVAAGWVQGAAEAVGAEAVEAPTAYSSPAVAGSCPTGTTGGSASIAVQPSTVYLLKDVTGLMAAVSYAGDAQLAHYSVSSAGPVSGSIVIRP